MIPGALSAATTTVRAPLSAHHGLAPFPRAPENPEHGFEANRERILITLLALDLMLMAFFVVMNSAATFDAKRGAAVASSLAPVPAPVLAPKAETLVSGTAARVAASAQLRAAVTAVFDAFLPQGAAGVSAAADDGRVDLEMPGALDPNVLPQTVIAGLAQVMDNPPAGYRLELLIRAPEESANLAHVAQDLTAAGVAADALSVGMPAKGQQSGVHFTFLLLAPGEETRAADMAGGGRP